MTTLHHYPDHFKTHWPGRRFADCRDCYRETHPTPQTPTQFPTRKADPAMRLTRRGKTLTIALLALLALAVGFATGPYSWDGTGYSSTLVDCEWAWDTAETEADLAENEVMGC